MLRKSGSHGRPASRAVVAAILFAVSLSGPSIGSAAEPAAAAGSSYRPRDWDYAQDIPNQWRRESLERFLPKRTGDFILPWETISWQVFEGLGMAPPYARALPDGRRLLWGCRRHSCDEKGAVIVSPEGEVEAAALIHARCRFTAFPVRLSEAWRKSNYDCDTPNRTLTVFVHVTQKHRPAFEHWAEAVTGKHLPVEIYWV